ncbi:MAG: hypothetical protein WBA37_15415 [Xanthobacteraceae bacterium]
MSLANLRAANEKRWSVAKLTRPFNSTANRLLAAKSRYRVVEAKTGVPSFVIAVIQERESSQLWSASLAQCNPWNKISTHVPKGRGPFNSWEEAAIGEVKSADVITSIGIDDFLEEAASNFASR